MVRLLLGAVALLLLASPALAGAPPLVVVETLDNEITCRLLRLDSAAGELSLSQEAIESNPMPRVLSLRFESRTRPRDASDHEAITLINGSSFLAAAHTVSEGRIDFELTTGGRVRVAATEVHSWEIAAEARGRLSEGASASSVADRLLVRARSGEGLTPVDGVVQSLDSEGVDFRLGTASGGDSVRAPWGRIAGVRFYRQSGDKLRPPAAVVLAGGERFAATSVKLDGRLLRWSSDDGVRGETPLDAVARIDLAADRITPASELPLLASEWKPDGAAWADRAGRAFGHALDGGPIRLRLRDARATDAWPGVFVTRDFADGVALASEGEAQFRLPPQAKRVKCLVGLDPATAEAGDCEVSILLGERIAWSARVDGATAPKRIVIDPEGAETLTLRVDYGANSDAGDRVHFANLRVIQ